MVMRPLQTCFQNTGFPYYHRYCWVNRCEFDFNFNFHVCSRRLTKGASTGAGLGNAFLANVRAVDGIFQVVRAFDDAEVIHVEGDVNPLRDMEIISVELRLKDIEWIQKHLEGLTKSGRSLNNNSLADKAKKEEIVMTQKILRLLKEENKDVRKGDWTAKEVRLLWERASVFTDRAHYCRTGGVHQLADALDGEARNLPGKPVGKGLHQEEKQMVTARNRYSLKQLTERRRPTGYRKSKAGSMSTTRAIL